MLHTPLLWFVVNVLDNKSHVQHLYMSRRCGFAVDFRFVVRYVIQQIGASGVWVEMERSVVFVACMSRARSGSTYRRRTMLSSVLRTFSGGRRAVAELSDPAAVTARQSPALIGRVTSNHGLLLLLLLLRRQLMTMKMMCVALILPSLPGVSRQLPHPCCQLDIGATGHCT